MFKLIPTILIAAAISAAPVRAEWAAPPPVQHLPTDLSGLPTSELVEKSKKYRAMLPELLKVAKTNPDAEAQYPDAQRAYDEARLKIGAVLDELVNEYKVQGVAKTKMEEFSNRFHKFEAEKLDPAQAEYPNFDMHVSFTFAALRVLLTNHPEIESRFLEDADKPESTLGAYYAQLDEASSRRDEIKAAIDARQLSSELKSRLERIDAELVNKRGEKGI